MYIYMCVYICIYIRYSERCIKLNTYALNSIKSIWNSNSSTSAALASMLFPGIRVFVYIYKESCDMSSCSNMKRFGDLYPTASRCIREFKITLL